MMLSIFSHAFWPFGHFSGEMSIQVLCPLLIGLFLLSCRSYLKLPIRYDLDIFSHSMDCLFSLLIVSFDAQTFEILVESNLCNFSFVACAFGVMFKKSLTNPVL